MERGYPGYILTYNQRVHTGLCPLQRADGLQVAKMSNDVVIGQNAPRPW